MYLHIFHGFVHIISRFIVKVITLSAIRSHSNFFLTIYEYYSSLDYNANLHSVMNTFPLFAVDFLFLLNDHPLSTQTCFNFRNKW